MEKDPLYVTFLGQSVCAEMAILRIGWGSKVKCIDLGGSRESSASGGWFYTTSRPARSMQQSRCAKHTIVRFFVCALPQGFYEFEHKIPNGVSCVAASTC